MWMTNYIREIQRQFIEVYNYPENPNLPGVPVGVTDGEYPMTIEGRLDNVRVINDKISCCNFDAQPA